MAHRIAKFILPLVVAAVCAAVGIAAEPVASGPAGRYGLRETCDDPRGWYQWDDDGKPVPPEVKSIQSKDGKLAIEFRRGRLEYAKNFSWVAEGPFTSAILRKDYGDVDLDKYHYLLCRIEEKGSSVFIGVNGYDTKAGYTTGLTVIDLKDCDSPKLHGRQTVRLELDLHENSTSVALDELALVSELTDEEAKALVPRGVSPREERLEAKPYHALEALRARCGAPAFPLDRAEQAVFHDTATGGLLTRLTGSPAHDGFSEGGIWSPDGACLFFEGQDRAGLPIYWLADGRVTAGPRSTNRLWSPVDPYTLVLLDIQPDGHYVMSWDRRTGKTATLAVLHPKDPSGVIEFGMTLKSGRITVAYRERDYAYVIDPAKPEGSRVEEVKLSTRLKGFGYTPEEDVITWYNCYTYEKHYRVLATGEEGLGAAYWSGHTCEGTRNTVGNFTGLLKLLVPNGLVTDRRPGDKLRIWGNYASEVVTDYGHLTDDSKWIFANGIGGDVKDQHVMVPSADPGAVLRLTRYFTTYYDWSSATYNRPSPDYTKLVFISDVLDNADLWMVTTRRPDPPRDVRFRDGLVTWTKGERSAEVSGYHVYAAEAGTGRGYRRLTTQPVTALEYRVSADLKPAGLAVAVVEHSGLEGVFSPEVGGAGPHALFFPAEGCRLTPPARPVYDGRCEGFQYVRITPAAPDEKIGRLEAKASDLGEAEYQLYVRTRGKGAWSARLNDRDLPAAAVDSADWQWTAVGGPVRLKGELTLRLESSNVDLSADLITLQPAGVPAPTGLDPRDTTPPEAPANFKAEAMEDGRIRLSWEPPKDADFSHCSVYAGNPAEFACGNETIIRSVKIASIVDTGPARGAAAHYKLVAYDSRGNASRPASASVTLGGERFLKTYQVEDNLADHLQTVEGDGRTYVTSKAKGGYFEIPVDVPEGWYRLWLDYAVPFYQNVPADLMIDGKRVGAERAMTLRMQPATITFKKLDAKNAHLFSDPLRTAPEADLFFLKAGKHVLRVNFHENPALFDKVHLTNDGAYRPEAYDVFVRPKLKGRRM